MRLRHAPGQPEDAAPPAAFHGVTRIPFDTGFVRLVYTAAAVLVVAVTTTTRDWVALTATFAALLLLVAILATGVATRRQARSLLRQLVVQHRVAIAGIGGGVDDVADRVVHELLAVLDLRGAAVLLFEDDGALTVRGSTLLTQVAPGDVVAPLPGLTIERALATGEVQQASPEDIARIRATFPQQHGSVVVPLAGSSGLLGVLVLDDGEHGHLDRVLLGELADLVVVTLEAARALDREAALAMRYQELDAMRSEFVAVTSHELRTPIGAIAGAVETLERLGPSLGDEVQQSLVDVTLRQTDRLVRLVQDLQTTASADMGTLTIRDDVVDIAALVGDSVGDVMRPSGTDLVVTLPDGPVTVRGDGDRLAQVVTNLVRNALDHGGAHVVVELSREADEAMLVVADDGPGVNDNVRESLFERFSRGTDVDRHSRGMGLGLAVAHELTAAMGGSLALADAAPGTGATFVLRLPLVAVDEHDRELVVSA